MSPSNGHALRRSSRLPVHVPIHVTSMETNSRFSEVCETLVVNAHGCAFQIPIKLNAGSVLHLHSKEGREATAYVVACHPMGPNGQSWMLGARLDHPDNFWGLESYPDDWRVLEMPVPSVEPRQTLSVAPVIVPKSQAPSKVPQAVLEKIEQQLSEERLRGILNKLVRPLESEINELNEKLARRDRQNRFEVSLGSIPPELEEKLWERLRQNLGARVLEQTKQQSAEILASTKIDTEQKIGAALTEFRHRLAGEMHAVEQRAQELSKDLSRSTRQWLQSEIEKLTQQTVEARAQLSAQGEKISASLEQRLTETHNVHRREIEKLHTAAAARASQLDSQVSELTRRIATMNESVRHLESDLDLHLATIAEEIVTKTRTQLDTALAVALKEFQTRGSSEVESRIDEVCSHLRSIQNRIEHSFAGSLTTQGEEAVQSVEQQFQELAEQSMDRWRVALASDLSSVAKSLGQQVRKEFKPEPVRD